MLSHNGLLFAALNFLTARQGTPPPTWPITIGRISALATPVPLLLILWLYWGAVADYKDASSDLAAAMKTIKVRTIFAIVGVYHHDRCGLLGGHRD